jgi:hypothetical protein
MCELIHTRGEFFIALPPITIALAERLADLEALMPRLERPADRLVRVRERLAAAATTGFRRPPIAWERPLDDLVPLSAAGDDR